MSISAAATASSRNTRRGRSSPLTSKQVMSIFGVVPLGAYVLAHLWTNLYSLNGAVSAHGLRGYDEAVRASRANPGILFLEIFGLGVPLVLHAVIGLQLLLKMRPNNLRYNRFRNLKFLLQRLSALGLLLFLGAHVLKARILPATENRIERWDTMHEALSEPITFTVYILGMLAVAYHLANGVWSSSITLGRATTPKAQRRMEWFAGALMVLILAMGYLSIYGFEPTIFGPSPALD